MSERIKRLREKVAESLACDACRGCMVVVEPEQLAALIDVAEVAEQLADEIERRTAHDEWRAAGSRGMSAPFHGDLASAPPSVMGVLRRWLRDLRKAQGGEL